MDIQAHGSEYVGRNISSPSDLKVLIHELTDMINKHFALNPNLKEDILSFILFMLIKCRYELIKLKSGIRGNTDRESVENLIKSINKIVCHKRFEGIYAHRAIIKKHMLLMKIPSLMVIHKKYLFCIKCLKECNFVLGAVSSNKDIVWIKDEVLVGTLRNREQINIILKNNFYHIPEVMIPEDKRDISYVAIYQSKNLFGKDAGIRYFGKVISSKRVKRKDITEIPSKSEEMYIRYTIDKWCNLGKVISPGRGGTVVAFTNLYMLLRADITDELYFHSEDEYKLYRSIKTSLEKDYDKVATTFNGHVIAIYSGNITVYRDKRQVYNILVRDYIKNPVSGFYSVVKACKSR